MSDLIYRKSLLLSGNDLIKSQSFFPFIVQMPLTAWNAMDLQQAMTKR